MTPGCWGWARSGCGGSATICAECEVIADAGASAVQAHQDCPSGSLTLSQTENVSLGGSHRAWLVHDEIGGQQLTDYWVFLHRRWEFGLVLSKLGAFKLYGMSPRQHAAALGCAH